jgi:hypothetical protein
MIRQTLNGIVIRGLLRGHKDTPFGKPIPGCPIGRPGVGHPQGIFGIFSYHYVVIVFSNMVCLTVALACTRLEAGYSQGNPFPYLISPDILWFKILSH